MSIDVKKYEDLLLKMNSILDKINTIEDFHEKRNYIKSKENFFWEFKDEYLIMASIFQFEKQGDEEQNRISRLLKTVTAKLLSHERLFDSESSMCYFQHNILEIIMNNEKKYPYTFQKSGNIEIIRSVIQYLKDNRNVYKQSIVSGNFYNGQDLNESKARQYIDYQFEKGILSNLIIFFRTQFANLSEDEIDEIFQILSDNEELLKEIFKKSFEKMSFDEKNTVIEYCGTVLRIKSIFEQKKLKNDVVILLFANGEVHDIEVIEKILENMPLKTIEDLIQFDYAIDNFFIKFSEFLNSMNFKDKEIADIISFIIKNKSDEFELDYQLSQLLADMGLTENYEDFINSKFAEEHKWIIYIYEILNEKNGILQRAKNPFLSLDYYEKVFESSAVEPDTMRIMVSNLLELLKSKNLSQKERERIKEIIWKCFEKDTDSEKIRFDLDVEYDELCINVREAYSLGQIIPYDVAKKILKKVFEIRKKNIEINSRHEENNILLEEAVRSVIYYKMKELGIDRQIYFGYSKKTLGYNNDDSNAIWINLELIDSYGRNYDLIDTMFHEMNHAILNYNAKNGNFEYNTYLMIKQDTIRMFDENFYHTNYKILLGEIDSQLEGILGIIDFMNEILVKNGKKAYSLDDEFKDKRENQQRNKGEHGKTLVIGDSKLEIDMSEFLGQLIRRNSEILEKNKILQIEYKKDGQRKSIREMLDEFKQHNKPGAENIYGANWESVYLIYYGIIEERMKCEQAVDDDLRTEINEFMSMNLVSVNALKQYYDEVNPYDMKFAIRRHSATRFYNDFLRSDAEK